MTLILGIDPGLQRTGWGVIASRGNTLSYIASGLIKTDPSLSLAKRLHTLHSALAEAIARHAPQEAALEETFVNVNGASTLKLGQCRGAILLTLTLANLPVGEYSATSIKKSLTGAGRAEKAQVAAMVRRLLPGCREQPADVTDALATAICHAHSRAWLNAKDDKLRKAAKH